MSDPWKPSGIFIAGSISSPLSTTSSQIPKCCLPSIDAGSSKSRAHESGRRISITAAKWGVGRPKRSMERPLPWRETKIYIRPSFQRTASGRAEMANVGLRGNADLFSRTQTFQFDDVDLDAFAFCQGIHRTNEPGVISSSELPSRGRLPADIRDGSLVGGWT